jgi:hypothetical protein
MSKEVAMLADNEEFAEDTSFDPNDEWFNTDNKIEETIYDISPVAIDPEDMRDMVKETREFLINMLETRQLSDRTDIYVYNELEDDQDDEEEDFESPEDLNIENYIVEP